MDAAGAGVDGEVCVAEGAVPEREQAAAQRARYELKQVHGETVRRRKPRRREAGGAFGAAGYSVGTFGPRFTVPALRWRDPRWRQRWS